MLTTLLIFLTHLMQPNCIWMWSILRSSWGLSVIFLKLFLSSFWTGDKHVENQGHWSVSVPCRACWLRRGVSADEYHEPEFSGQITVLRGLRLILKVSCLHLKACACMEPWLHMCVVILLVVSSCKHGKENCGEESKLLFWNQHGTFKYHKIELIALCQQG